MPEDSFRHVKIRDSSDFLDDSFRTIKMGSGGIKALIGKRPGSDVTEVVTLLFPKAKFSLQEAKQWVKDHKESLTAKVEAYLILEAAEDTGEEPETVSIAAEFTELAEAAIAMALPQPTISKVYAIARLHGFYPIVNANKDAFTPESVGEAYKTLIGSPVLAEPKFSDHGEDKATGKRRKDVAQTGTIVSAEIKDEGVDLLIAFLRERLDEMGVDPKDLVDEFALSMEATFLKSRAMYVAGGKDLTFEEALEMGIASPLGQKDDRSKYDARIISPIEYPAVMLLRKGKNADKTAEFDQVTAVVEVSVIDAILWYEADFEAYEASEGAVLTTKQRKSIKKSDFAYVDENGEGHLPIHDAAHVKNALARLNQTKISAAAKRKAFRKILAAAKKFGVEVDKDSDVYKAYAAKSYEDIRMVISDALYHKHPNMYTMHTFEDHIIASEGRDKMFRIKYKIDEDGEVELGDPIPVEIKFVPVKSAVQGGAMDTITLTQAELDAKLVEAAKAAVDEFRAKELPQIVQDELGKAKPEIEQAAVAFYKEREKAVADRMKELHGISPIEDADRAGLEEKARAADDSTWKDMLIERLRAVKAVTTVTAARTDTPLAPTLRAGKAGEKTSHAFSVVAAE